VMLTIHTNDIKTDCEILERFVGHTVCVIERFGPNGGRYNPERRADMTVLGTREAEGDPRCTYELYGHPWHVVDMHGSNEEIMDYETVIAFNLFDGIEIEIY